MSKTITATYMGHVFIPSSTDGHSGRFHAPVIVNSAALSTGVHVPFQIMLFSRYKPSGGTAGSYQCMCAESRKNGTQEPVCRAGRETRT